MATSLTDEQKLIVEKAEAGHNLLVSGQAGTGKSFVINMIVPKLRRKGAKVVTVCSSGISCSVYDGDLKATTVHSHYALQTANMPADLVIDRTLSMEHQVQRIAEADTIIWDKAGMSSQRIFELVNAIYHEVACDVDEGNSFKPFAGKQMIIVGEFVQLRPVPNHFDDSNFMFQSKVFEIAISHRCELQKQMRLENADSKLVKALSELRLGQCSPETAEYLKSLSRPMDNESEFVHIYFKKLHVQLYNLDVLFGLPGEIMSYECVDSGNVAGISCPADETLLLKKGAKVMIVWNISEMIKNGTAGIFCGETGDGRLEVEIEGLGKVPIKRETWSKRERTGNVVGSREQFPIVLFYASTCHKAQGLTLPGVIVHCSNEFVSGLHYVSDSRVRDDCNLRILNFKPSQLLQPPADVLRVCKQDAVCKDDLSCCRNKVMDEKLFSVGEKFIDYGDQDGDAPESLSMLTYADGLLPAYFDKEGVVPAVHVDLATVFLSIDEKDTDEQLSQPSDDFDVTVILTNQLLPSQYLDASSPNFAFSRNNEIQKLLSEEMLPELTLFTNILWFRIFQLFGDYLANNSSKVVIPRKGLTESMHSIYLNIIGSVQYRQELCALFGIQDTQALSEDQISVGSSLCTETFKFIVHKIAEMFSTDGIEDEANASCSLDDMPIEGLAKIRHVGGWAVHKVLEHWRRYVRANMLSPVSTTRQKVKAAHGKRDLLDDHVIAQYSLLKEKTAYPGTLEVTEDRQYRERGLLHITDQAYLFFRRMEEMRVALLNVAAMGKAVDKSEFVDRAIQEILKDDTIDTRWKDMFQELDPGKKVLAVELMNEVIERYMSMGASQFLKDFRRTFQLKKTAEHRKRVLQRQAIAAEKKDHLQYDKVVADRSIGKAASHHHLCTYARKHGVAGIKWVYMKAQLAKLCRAYGIIVKAAQNKPTLAANLVAKLTSAEVSGRMPFPEYVNELRAEAALTDEGHVVASFSLYAMICHIGPNCESGHYVSCVKKGSQWFFIDDSNVRRVDIEEFLIDSSTAYLLFYEQSQEYNPVRTNQVIEMLCSTDVDEAVADITVAPTCSMMTRNNTITAGSAMRFKVYRKGMNPMECWLNDECVNVYSALLARKLNRTGENVYIFSTFVLAKLIREDFCKLNDVAKLTAKGNLMQKRFWVLPFHRGQHWSVVIVNVITKEILYFDSYWYKKMVLPPHFLENLGRFATELCSFHGYSQYTKWTEIAVQDIPKQRNTYDCGIFMLNYVQCVVGGKQLSFQEEDMPKMTMSMLCEIVQTSLPKPSSVPPISSSTKPSESKRTPSKSRKSTETSGIKPSQLPAAETAGTKSSQSPAPETAGTKSSQSSAPETLGTKSSQSPAPETAGTKPSQSPAPETAGTNSSQSPAPETAGTKPSLSPAPETAGIKPSQSVSRKSTAGKTLFSSKAKIKTSLPSAGNVMFGKHSRPKVERRKRRSNLDKADFVAPLKRSNTESILSFVTRHSNDDQRSTNDSLTDCSETTFKADGKLEDLIPLKGADLDWYKNRGILAGANTERTRCRVESSVIEKDGERMGLLRGTATGSLVDNAKRLVVKISSAESEQQLRHLGVILAIARYIIENGPLVPTQTVAKLYKESKGLKQSHHLRSSSMLETLGKHLNLIQVYVEGKGFVLENHGAEVQTILKSLKQIERSDDKIVNKRVEETIGSSYQTILKYLDSKRDRDTVKAILTKITSATFVADMAQVQDKRAFQHSKNRVAYNLDLFKAMENKIIIDDKNLDAEQRRKKKTRLLQQMKLEKLRHVFRGRGRILKCEEFPDLAGIMEYVFGIEDQVDRAGGGVESHPRLTDTVLYRAVDNHTMMKHARETILALAPEGFSISLSSCFNYTQNYREGTYQSRRHHAGRGINAMLSLHKPPRTGVEKFVINLHWSTQNVNLTLDASHAFPGSVMVDSKDAKAKVNSEVSPVQKPGKTWKKIILPDHDWDRSTHNTVTPMTHLFVETDLTLERQDDDDKFFCVRRTGTAATIIDLTYFEPQTVQRVFNELFLLLVNPALDTVFRNPDTGRLKEHFVFIVDNGPAEAPASPLVSMWLVRLARFLQFESVTQKSFAEYHSKRNPVERVHAVHNRALSNEVFGSRGVHQDCQVGDEQHLKNMEHMAEEVRKCLSCTQYGDRPCLVLRGIGKDVNFIFGDEEQLVTYMGKSEGRKHDDTGVYRPVKNELYKDLVRIWDLNENFVGSYREDYQVLQNMFDEEGGRTAWKDKYSTIIHNPDIQSTEPQVAKKFELQPVPDYVRWLRTGGELHYVPYEKLSELETRVINDTPAAFLPSHVLEIAFKVIRHQRDEMLPLLSLLSWCPEKEVKRFFEEYQDKLDKKFKDDQEREYWSQHDLYKQKSKSELQDMARDEKLPFEGKKHEHVKRLVLKLNLAKPPDLEPYSGNLESVPHSVSEIAKLSIYQLKEVLRCHNIIDSGIKDELVIRVGMLKGGRSDLVFRKEEEGLLNLVTAAQKLIAAEKKLFFCDPTVVYKRRKYSTANGPSLQTVRPRDSASIAKNSNSAFVRVPGGIDLDNLDDVLQPIHVEILASRRTASGNIITSRNQLEPLRIVGAKVLAFWGKDDLGDSGWSPGWYAGTVKSYTKSRDTIDVQFDKEPDSLYHYLVKEEYSKLKLAKSVATNLSRYEELAQIGSVVEMYWDEEHLKETGWTAGWYEAEVQGLDYDDDEVDLVFTKEPDRVYKVPVLPNLVSGTLRIKH